MRWRRRGRDSTQWGRPAVSLWIRFSIIDSKQSRWGHAIASFFLCFWLCAVSKPEADSDAHGLFLDQSFFSYLAPGFALK